MAKKLWDGRFSGETNIFADEWAASIAFDKRLYREDIRGSIAHARMLAARGILSAEELRLIESGLLEIRRGIENGEIDFDFRTEDIHMSIEALLTGRIGDAGKRLHTARSRNDQIATDIRLFLKDEILRDAGLLSGLRSVLLSLAEQHTETVMPGYTHLQHAQPVSFAFHLLAYVSMFSRDAERLMDCYKRTDALPLGSGALAGTSYDTDRPLLAEELGFARVIPNAMDAVSDRDFLLEYLAAAAICMMHLSRFCEELILWSSSEFAFVEMDDAFSTGSSIMPQKKNPDMAELIRGKTGRVYGDLTALLTVMKGLPLAYNKDMQEDKEPLFDAADTLAGCLTVFTEMLRTMKVNAAALSSAADKGFMNATDAADYLAKKGLPFRECHEIIGKIVLYCIDKGVSIEDLSLDELQGFSDKFEGDIYEKITPLACMNAKVSEGSTAEASVRAQIEKARTED
ncbi:MAG: argininosuccinate lyase [Clostridiales Family XIII bacterium]|jgi:argininosuccinate lyase|nr:argininosuccinate lyase [Clostridiales Family XIII bacterium]